MPCEKGQEGSPGGAMEPQGIVSNWRDLSAWSTRQLPKWKQFDRWCEFVNEAHLHWSIRRDRYETFPAFIREGRFGDFRMASLTAAQSRVKGTRDSGEIAQDREAFYNLIHIVRGSICLIIDGQEVDLQSGQFVLWDSSRPMIFITGENLHQVTLAVTHERLHRSFPQARNFVGKALATTSGLNKIFSNHLLSLDDQFGDLACNHALNVLDSTLDLLAATLDSGFNSSEKYNIPDLLLSIQRYIDENLDDFELTIPKIAMIHGISVRHLHRLFQKLDTSVANYIMRRRLDRCRKELSYSSDQGSITDIAFRWGFRDSGTFSKTFRREFGTTPREFRAYANREP